MKTKMTVTAALVVGLLQCPLPGVESTDKPPSIQASHSGDLHDLIQDFRDQNAEYIAARRELRRQLAETYDPAERLALIHAFRVEYRDQILAQRNLRKSFRQAHMDLRRERRRDQRTAQD
jgi:hypothetical protein